MAITDRLRDAAVHRETEADDGFGGLVETDAQVLANVRCEVYPISPWDREILVQKLGVEIGRAATLLKGVLADGSSTASSVLRWDIIRFAATERYQVLGVHPVRGRGGAVHHYSTLLMEADSENV